jgi:parvulin-like peptidyl-prolyl isomerase
MTLPWRRSINATAEVEAAPRRRTRGRSRRQVRAEDARRVSVRAQEERRRQRLAITVGAMLILAIVAIVAVGYFREFYQPPRVMAGEIRGVRFTMGDLVERIRVLQGINRNHPQGQGFVDLSKIPFQFLQDMLFDQIVRQAAPGLGLTVTEEDIDEQLKREFYPSKPAGQETDPGQLDREYQNVYSNFLTQVRLSDEEYRDMALERLYQTQLHLLLGADIPEKLEQVELEWIRMDHGGAVLPEDVRTRLEIEDFAIVAPDVFMPNQEGLRFADQGGYVGWVPQGAFPDLDDFIYGNEEDGREPLAVDEISQPVQTQDGIYLIHKLAGPEEQGLSPLMRFKLNTELVNMWRNEQLTRGSDEGWLKVNFDSDRYAWVADQVRLTAPRGVERGPAGGQGPPIGGR